MILKKQKQILFLKQQPPSTYTNPAPRSALKLRNNCKKKYVL